MAAEVVAKIILLPCMVVDIILLLGILFFSEKLTEFLKKHEKIQILIGFMWPVGLLGAFLARMGF